MRLLEMSISAGVLIMLLALLRTWGLEKLPKRMFVLLWIVVLVRLLLPASLPMPGGIATPAVRLLHKIAQAAGLRFGLEHSSTVSAAMPKAASSGVADGSGRNVLAGAKEAAPMLGLIWLVGSVGFGIYFAYSYFKEYRLLAQALPLKSDERQRLQVLSGTAQRLVGIRQDDKTKERLFTHDQIATPLVWGTLKQKIIFPKGMVHMGSAQIKYVLAHEMVHIRRRDNFWKLLSAAAVCIHWFNPLVWIMYHLFARDLELSCDERVIALYGSQSREEYAMALLTLVQDQEEARRTLFCSGFGKNPMKERIVAIMKYKKLTGVGLCCAIMLMAGATTVFATNDKSAAVEKDVLAAVEEKSDDGAEDVTESDSVDIIVTKNSEDAEQEEVQSVDYVITDDGGEAKLVEFTKKAAEEAMLVAGEYSYSVADTESSTEKAAEEAVQQAEEIVLAASADEIEEVSCTIEGMGGKPVNLDDLPSSQVVSVDGSEYHIQYKKAGSGVKIVVANVEKKK